MNSPDKNNSTVYTTATFVSIPSGPAMAIELVHPGDTAPEPLLSALLNIGWMRSLKGAMPRPGCHTTVMVRTMSTTRPPSRGELARHAKQARDALRYHGVGKVAHVQLETLVGA